MSKHWPSTNEFRKILKLVLSTGDGPTKVDWARNITRPVDADSFAFILIQVILGSGFNGRIADKIFSTELQPALVAGKPVSVAFKHPTKTPAMQWWWDERQRLFEEFQTLKDDEVIHWIDGRPFIGPVLKFQALRDLGVKDVAKPDRIMERIAAKGDETVQDLCQRLAIATGERVGTIDIVLWFAGSRGLISLD